MNDSTDYNARCLPNAVLDLAIRLGVIPQDNPQHVRLTQTGRMKRDLASDKWMEFTASQSISAKSCEFEWRASAGPLGIISAIDALAASEGRFDIMALGFIPIARAEHSAALVRGELMRYLAEIAWAPHAILNNYALHWQVIDSETLSVSAGKDETACQVILSLNNAGQIAQTFAADRPRSATPPTLPTPWRGWLSDYRQHGDIWLPFKGRVAWVIEGVDRIYWEGRLVSWTNGHSVG